MTCNYCGFENDDNAAKCIKCGAVLENQAAKPPTRPGNGSSVFGKTISENEAPLHFKKAEQFFDKTIKDSDKQNSSQQNEEVEKDILQVCEKCGFPNSGDAVICANCKNSFSNEADNKYKSSEGKTPVTEPLEAIINPNVSKQNYASTIDPYRKKEEKNVPKPFYFTPIAREGERKIITGPVFWPNKAFEFENEPVQINRENLEETNYTITSKIQAEVFNKEGRWYIVDKSELKTTFVQADSPLEIKEGDLLLIGDRKFIFSTETEDKTIGSFKETSR